MVDENGPDRESTAPDYQNVLISVANPQNAEQLIQIAKYLTGPGATFHIMNVTLQKPFPRRGASWRKGSDLVIEATHYANRLGRVAKPIATTADSIAGSILATAEDVGAGLIIMGWFGRITPVAVRRSSVVNKVLHKASCDVGVLKARGELGDLSKVTVPVGPNLRKKRLSLLKRLLVDSGAEAELVHVVTEEGEKSQEQAERYLEETAGFLDVPVKRTVSTAPDILEGLLGVSEGSDLYVIGPGREWVFNRFLFGRTADALTNRLTCSVFMFKSREATMVAWFRGLLSALGDAIKGSL